MPYLYQSMRDRLIEGDTAHRAGDLTYLVTKLCIEYISENGLEFQNCADVLAALDASSKEFYRRVVTPYEDKKIAENGDVYPLAWPR